MDIAELVQSMAKRTRLWRERAIEGYQRYDPDGLGYRPSSGTASFGWLLAHQAAVYDYSLNVLIKSGSPKNPEMFGKHTPGTDGEWTGVSLGEIEDYYSSGEEDLLAYVRSASDEELASLPEQDKLPSPFKGMSIIDLVANTFVHLGHHIGHLNAIVQDLGKKSQK
ncbi:MAG: DinB family protein [Candidatus Thorarchaeota archaeon]